MTSSGLTAPPRRGSSRAVEHVDDLLARAAGAEVQRFRPLNRVARSLPDDRAAVLETVQVAGAGRREASARLRAARIDPCQPLDHAYRQVRSVGVSRDLK